MKKASIVVHSVYQKNKLFDLSDKDINRDNCMYPFYLLKEKLKAKGYELSTHDINTIENSEIIIYNEMPTILPTQENIKKSYLLIFESELIKKENWNFVKHKYFNKIFTWKDDILDNKKYFKLNFSQQIIININKNFNKKEKLCTLIAGNKKVNHPLELYSKRVKAIRWFEENHPEDFEFYGIGWDRHTHSNKYIRFLLRKTKIDILFKPNFLSYRGRVNSKKETLQRYKFSICYENAKDIPGYITEKIFDSFFAGCVPIYWGANNIQEKIPKECFIDKRDFSTYEELYEFMKNVSDKEYLNYLNNIENFLNSSKSHQFSDEFFVNQILRYCI